MIIFRSLIPFLLLILVLANCSSVTKLEGITSNLEKPAYNPLDAPANALFIPNPRDYKFRNKAKKKPVFIFAPTIFPGEFTKPLMTLFYEENKDLWTLSDATEVSIPVSVWSDEAKFKEELQLKDVDAVIYTEFFTYGDLFKVRQRVLDTINETEYGTIEYSVTVLKQEGEKPVKTTKKVEVYKTTNDFKVLEEIKVPILKIVNRPDKATLSKLLKSSVTGHLNVTSSSPETSFYLDNKFIGKLPLSDIPLDDGEHTIAFQKPGVSLVKRTMFFRAGEKVKLHHEWEDDLNVAAVKIISYPSGLKLSWDNQMKGETPLFMYGMQPGKYKVEFIQKDKKKDTNVVLKDFTLKLEPKRNNSLLFPLELNDSLLYTVSDFWQKALLPAFLPVFDRGLVLENTSGKDTQKWAGLNSNPILPDEIVIDGGIFLPQEMSDGIYTISFLGGDRTLTMEVRKEKVCVLRYDANTVVSSSCYMFKKDEKEKERKFSIYTKKEKEYYRVFLELGKTKVIDFLIDATEPWKVNLLVKDIPEGQSRFLKSLSFKYPAYIQQDK